MNTCVLCLGSNTADSHDKLRFALEELTQYVVISHATEPYGCPSYNGVGASYSNVVLAANTSLDIKQLVAATKVIEISAGRTPASKAEGVMPLDIDLVIFNDAIVSADDFRREHFQIGYQQLKSKT